MHTEVFSLLLKCLYLSIHGGKGLFVNYHQGLPALALSQYLLVNSPHYPFAGHQCSNQSTPLSSLALFLCTFKMSASLYLSHRSPPPWHFPGHHLWIFSYWTTTLCQRFSMHHLLSSFIGGVVGDPVLYPHLALCCLRPFSIALVFVQVPWEANTKKGLRMQGFYEGKCLWEGKWGRSSKGWRAMSDHEASLTPSEGQKEGGSLVHTSSLAVSSRWKAWTQYEYGCGFQGKEVGPLANYDPCS